MTQTLTEDLSPSRPAPQLDRAPNSLKVPRLIRSRVIRVEDLPAVTSLLEQGFREQRRRAFWERAIGSLGRHDTPSTMPRFGYLLESDGVVVGTVLLISTLMPGDDGPFLRCNLSSWCVADDFRAYAPMLVARALSHRDATYFNLTPARHTWPILEAQGFVRYCEGRFLAVPVLSTHSRAASDITIIDDDVLPGPDLSQAEICLLRAHSSQYDCLSLICTLENLRYPFVFARWRKHGVIRLASLLYCRDIADFTRLARSLGAYLASRGYFIVVIDANGPIDGLVGTYSGDRPKYYRGAHRPRLGDSAYSERVLVGF